MPPTTFTNTSTLSPNALLHSAKRFFTARDLGRAISVKLAAEGAKVCLNYFDNEADAQETLALIKNVGGEAIAVQGDMTKAAAVKNLFAGSMKKRRIPTKVFSEEKKS